MFDNGSTGVGLCSGERQTDPNQTLSAAELDSLYTAEYEELVYRLACEAETTHPADDEPHLLPNDLETIPPGIFLGAVLATVEVAKLTGFDLVRYVQAAERQVSHANADLYEGIGELGYADEADTNHRSPVVVEFVSEELQTALARTRRSADYELGLALDLRHRVPQVWEALGEGRIDLARARVFVDQLATLNPELIPAVLDQILDHAPELTTGQLRARLKKLIIAADPTTAQQDLEEGLEERRMVIYPNPDHTASLGLHSVDPLQAVAASEHIHKLAMRQNQLSGETRTLDQICADIALDLLQGKSTNADVDGVITAQPRIVLQVTEDSPTTHIPGYGPILTSQLGPQLLDQQAQIGHVEVEILTKTPKDCHHQTPGRRPTKAQAEHIRRTYPTCVFPGCRMPAEKCDLDHRQQVSKDGRTTCRNLAPLCRHHHVCKDQTNWKLERLPNGSHQWTSPLGHTYTNRDPPMP